MRTIKFLPDTGNAVVFQAANDLSMGQFIELLLAQDVTLDLNESVVVERQSRAIYADGTSILPNGDLVLVSKVKDPKGNSSRSEHYTVIQSLIKQDGEFAKNHFSKKKSYTNKKTVKLAELIESYAFSSNTNAPTPKVSIPQQVISSFQDVTQELKAFRNTLNIKLTRDSK
tara:strand:- start:6121 stop:6633 length:513 start_codon:yes stop_codon:yes gene_type:complete